MAATGVFTDLYREKYATVADIGLIAPQTLTSMKLSYFKIGEGGESGGSPVTPDPSRIDIEAQYDQAIYTNPPDAPAPHDSFFKKSFSASDVSASANILTIICLLSSSEGNNDGQGNSPSYYEVGVFDEDDDMIAYSTFNEDVKTSDKAIQKTITITF